MPVSFASPHIRLFEGIGGCEPIQGGELVRNRTSVCEESYAHLIQVDDQIDVGLERQGATETLMRMVCSNEHGTRDS